MLAAVIGVRLHLPPGLEVKVEERERERGCGGDDHDDDDDDDDGASTVLYSTRLVSTLDSEEKDSISRSVTVSLSRQAGRQA